MPDMTDRIALVTGAASGIGLATAEVLAREGADVALLSRPDDDLDGARHRVKQHGGRVVTVAADVTDPAAVRSAFERVESDLGPSTRCTTMRESRSSVHSPRPPMRCLGDSWTPASPARSMCCEKPHASCKVVAPVRS
jgi:NAD(P)-dependent dehydrogenase (short-subunit alcohol dehydrogenase family)